MSRKIQRLLCLFALVFTLSACAAGNNLDGSKQATLDAISAEVRATATAQAAAAQNPNAAVETAQAEATALSQSLLATQSAQSMLSHEARAATATAFAPFIAELPKYGVDPSQGHPGWIHPPVTLEVEGYMQYDYANQFIATVAGDFVVSSDITWDTQYGSSGCGFVLRSDGNRNALSQYLTIITRGASGHLLFATMVDGEVVTGKDIYAYGRDPNFQWANHTTNRLTVVGRGNTFMVYLNDSLVGEIDPTAPLALPAIPPPPSLPANADPNAMAVYNQKKAEHEAVATQIAADYQYRQRQAAEKAKTVFERGFIAMVVLSESGRSVCQFDNTWLWLIE